jgi:hypothetical protein
MFNDAVPRPTADIHYRLQSYVDLFVLYRMSQHNLTTKTVDALCTICSEAWNRASRAVHSRNKFEPPREI